MAEKQKRFSRRMIALFWLVGVSVVIGVLIKYEMISLLYVLATLALAGLLLVVSFADLENVGGQGFASKKE
jgi:hypothetical protein